MESSALSASTPKGLVRSYIEACGNAIVDPGKFFRDSFSELPLGTAVAVGIVSFWLSSFVAFLWDSLNFIFLTSLLDQWMEDVFQNDSAFGFFSFGPHEFLWKAGSLLLLPFWSLFLVLFAALIVYFFAKLLSNSQGVVNFMATIRILAFSLLGSWFLVVPIFGKLIAYIAILSLAMVGLRESFGVSNRRALMVLVLPQILFLCFIALLTTIFLALAFTMPWEAL